MIENAKQMINEAFLNKKAIPQFNINNLEWTKYILEECNNNNQPVILGVSEGAARYMGGYTTVVNLIKGLVKDLNIKISVAIHLDHGSSIDSCKKAIDAGFTSVMLDKSKETLEENIRQTNEVLDYAKNFNVSVEAEVGLVGGQEDDVIADLAYAKTEDCIKFCNETKIDFLAASLGSVHGFYKGEPKLDFEKMKEISGLCNIPLVLHGGTGIPDDMIKKAIASGIAKINLNTELQNVWANALKIFVENNKEEIDPRKIISSGEKAIKEVIQSKIKLYNE